MRTAYAALLSLPLVACAGLSSPDTTVFASGLLNATYYGAYARPVNDATPLADADAEARAERRDERLAIAEARADERDEARDARDDGRALRQQSREEQRLANAELRSERDEPANEEVVSNAPADSSNPTEQRVASADPNSIPIVAHDVYAPELAAAYIRAVYALNDVAIAADADIVDVWRQGQQNGTIYHDAEPAGGDLVFFHNTFDRNGDGRNNDWFTHVGIVEGVDSDGTISVLSYRAGRVGRTYLNLHDPSVGTRGGAEINSELREQSSGDPEFTQHLAGELFAGFVSLLGDVAEVRILDAWQPTLTSPVASR